MIIAKRSRDKGKTVSRNRLSPASEQVPQPAPPINDRQSRPADRRSSSGTSSTKRASKSATVSARRPRYPDGCVIADRLIERFVGAIRHRDLLEMGAIMQAVRDATRDDYGWRFDKAGLKLLKSIAAIDNARPYRSLLNKIVAAAESRTEEGIDAAYKTGLRAQEIAFECWLGDQELRRKYKRMISAARRAR